MRVVLITGCSSGIGLESALSFARAGDEVYASMRDLETSENLVSRAADEGLRLNFIELDVTRPDTFEDVVARIIRKDGQLDVLVNNAGVLPIGVFEELNENQLRRTMEVNFFGPALLSQAVLPDMRRQKSGFIIMLSSLSGIVSKSGDAVYSASKFALEGLAEGFRNEVARWGIKTALVEPGLHATNIFKDADPSDVDEASPYAALTKSILREVSSDESKGALPEDLARLLVEISRTDGRQLRWPVGDTAKRVLSTVYAQSDCERGAFLRGVSNIDWWINGDDYPHG